MKKLREVKCIGLAKWVSGFACSLVLGMVCALPGHVHADEPNRDARRLQLLQQRFQEEKSQLESENADLKKKLADQDAELTKLRAEQKKATATLAQREHELTGKLGETTTQLKDTQTQEAEQKKASDAEIAKRDRELADLKKVREAENTRMQAQLDDARKVINTCSANNEKLEALGVELLDLYRNKSVWDAVKHQDLVLGLSNVDAFNLVQSYRDKIDAERFKNPLIQKP